MSMQALIKRPAASGLSNTYVQGQDQFTPTSIGTSVTKTQLNAGVALTTPNEARNLIGVVPWQAPNAALTAAQSMLCKFEFESKAVKDINPKALCASPVHGGLSTFTTALVPALMVFPFNMPIFGNEDISAYGTALVANTAAPDAAADVKYSSRPPNASRGELHTFWDGPTDETATGTAAADGIVGGAFTLNSPRQSIIRWLYTILGVGTVTASEAYMATGRLSSNDFQTSMPVLGAAQPMATGVHTFLEVMQPNVPLHDIWIPCKPTARITTLLNLQEALTSAGNFWSGCGFYRF